MVPLSVAILLLIALPAFAEEAYVCVADLATGFVLDKAKNEWRASTFSGPLDKFVVSKAKPPEGAFRPQKTAWEVKATGERVSQIWCTDDFNEFGNLICRGLTGDFRMNKNNLRFLYSYHMGYWNDRTGTPFMQIGKCSSM